jgi:prepilin-type N-terminal cleavage/methylation domain-containing protein
MQNRGSFTLVELLVVIAIISILAALLTPALSSARGQAKSAACMSNLKQQGTLLALYTDDYNGIMPPTDSIGIWYRLLYPYINVKNMATGQSVFYCPSYGKLPDDNNGHCYAMDRDAGSSMGGLYRPVLLTDLQSNLYKSSGADGARWLVTESMWYFLDKSTSQASSSYPGTGVMLRHRSRASVLFPDLHVDSMNKHLMNTNLFVFKQVPIQ